ncbi:hypothetical protein PATSB16_30130 [Pandoraea thiooxydans]|uniref:Uncharacterized protein n=1 Tax=Pandoraea thiooxydans TaxID=445709 RepID=A0A0G3EVT4_9BURK|nr:hypothetical protein [Pandoraea thiooxydans]AKJ68866.1 hypothetical protein ABW99_12195 [Pandoraea thiooxydans]APR96351.1 hypothetical protein PATSB16_30130 [Pandoraea thiooxydans]
MAIGEIAAATGGAGMAAMPPPAVSAANSPQPDPADVQAFDQTMSANGANPADTTQVTTHVALDMNGATPASGMSGFLGEVRDQVQGLGDSFTRLAQQEPAMLQSMRDGDYTGSMIAMTEFSLSSQMALAKCNIDLGLVQAGNNFCGSMLRVQQEG